MSESKQSAKKMQGKVLSADAVTKNTADNIVTISSTSQVLSQLHHKQTAINEEQFAGSGITVKNAVNDNCTVKNNSDEEIIIEEELIFSLNRSFIRRIILVFFVSGLLIFISGMLFGLYLSMNASNYDKNQSVNKAVLSFSAYPTSVDSLSVGISDTDVSVMAILNKNTLLEKDLLIYQIGLSFIRTTIQTVS